VFAVSPEKPVDPFILRRRFPLLKPLLHAEYGSATSIAADKAAQVDVPVSTTGLSIRRVGKAERGSSRGDGGKVE
jgi:hypothetical protein